MAGLIEYTCASIDAGTAAAVVGVLLAVVCTATTRTLSPACSSAAGSSPFFNATATREEPAGGVSFATVAPPGSSCPALSGAVAYCPTMLVRCDQSRETKNCRRYHYRRQPVQPSLPHWNQPAPTTRHRCQQMNPVTSPSR